MVHVHTMYADYGNDINLYACKSISRITKYRVFVVRSIVCMFTASCPCAPCQWAWTSGHETSLWPGCFCHVNVEATNPACAFTLQYVHIH